MKIGKQWWRISAHHGRWIIKESDPTESLGSNAVRSFIESLVKPKAGTTVYSECNDNGRGWEVISRWEYLGGGNWAGKEI